MNHVAIYQMNINKSNGAVEMKWSSFSCLPRGQHRYATRQTLIQNLYKVNILFNSPPVSLNITKHHHRLPYIPIRPQEVLNKLQYFRNVLTTASIFKYFSKLSKQNKHKRWRVNVNVKATKMCAFLNPHSWVKEDPHPTAAPEYTQRYVMIRHCQEFLFKKQIWKKWTK